MKRFFKAILGLAPKHKVITTPKAPAAIGPYSQAIRAQGLLFLSGQIPIDPRTNMIALFDGDLKQQTELVLSNIQAILEAAGCNKTDVLKTTILLTDISDFEVVNEVYARFFGEHKPARATYAVSALPKGANIEIEAIAIAPC